MAAAGSAGFTHPETFTALQWRARKAGMVSGGVSETDPRYAECDAALAYLKIKGQLNSCIDDGVFVGGPDRGEQFRDAMLAQLLSAMIDRYVDREREPDPQPCDQDEGSDPSTPMDSTVAQHPDRAAEARI
jgi:hypothetical protein